MYIPFLSIAKCDNYGAFSKVSASCLIPNDDGIDKIVVIPSTA